MQEFKPGYIKLKPPKEQIAEYMQQHGLDRKAAKKFYNEMMNDEIWINDIYQVAIHRNTPNHNMKGIKIDHFSIKRRDKEPVHDWRDLQEIKNLLAGPEFEAIEIYPRESRRVDTANQYHLWVFPEGVFVPMGWSIRLVSDEVEAEAMGAKQRAFK